MKALQETVRYKHRVKILRIKQFKDDANKLAKAIKAYEKWMITKQKLDEEMHYMLNRIESNKKTFSH